MRAGKLFAFTVAFAFAAGIAAVAFAPLLQHTALSSWAEKAVPQLDLRDYEYQPPQGLTTFIGDFVWGLVKALQLLGSTPQLVAELLAALGVPEPWARAITFAATFSLIAYIIYMVSGRVLSVS